MAATQTQERQIADGAITNAKVKAGAAIDSSKLADGGNFTKKDGSVAFTANQSMGGNKLTSLGAPTAGSTDAARQVDLENAISGLDTAYKYRTVRVKSTANVTISAPGTATFDGISLTSGDADLGTIMLASQTAGAENGLYLFNGTGSPMTRLANSNAWTELTGSLVNVLEGTTNGGTRWKNTNATGGTLGTTAVTYGTDSAGGYGNSNFADKETPSGSINGSNVTFTLANTPTTGSEHVFLNGLLQESGAGNDYTISGATITLLTAPLSGERIKVSYRR